MWNRRGRIGIRNYSEHVWTGLIINRVLTLLRFYDQVVGRTMPVSGPMKILMKRSQTRGGTTGVVVKTIHNLKLFTVESMKAI